METEQTEKVDKPKVDKPKEKSDMQKAQDDVKMINKRLMKVRDLGPAKDMFFVANARPERVYFHAEDNPIRIRQLELKGWVICDGNEIVGSPLGIKTTGDASNANLPRHRLMWTSKDNYARIEAEKDERLRRHELDIKDSVDNVKKVLERSGLGRASGKLSDDEIKF